MEGLYWFSLIVGGGLLAVSALGDVFGGAVDADADIDVDDTDAFRIFSIRNATYFVFAFGATGLLLEWMWGGARSALAAIVAAAVGFTSVALAAAAFAYVRRHDSGTRPSDESFVGTTGRVSLALARDRSGRVVVRRGNREFELRARAFDPDAPGSERWTRVVVVAIEDGTALVAPLEEPNA